MKLQYIFKINSTFSLFLFLGLGLLSSTIYAQTTAIPDSFFERALIAMGIDSDGTINGQVLTSDIESVQTLNIAYRSIEDLTGLQDFAALEILDVTANELTILDVDSNIQLRELYCSSSTGAFEMALTSLNLTNNVNLEILYAENLVFLESLNVKNGNNSILTVTLSCEFEGEPCALTELHCVTVDDEVSANNDEFPYSRWFIQADFVYSEDCSLGITSPEVNAFSLSPNPARDILFLNSKIPVQNVDIRIFTVEGKLVNVQSFNSEKQISIDVSNLSKGVYFLNIENENGNMAIKKFVKE